MFEAATWAMSFPDLFPWGDGLPFLKRETSLDASELFRYLLLRKELEYDEPAPLPRCSLSAPWVFLVLQLEFLCVLETGILFNITSLSILMERPVSTIISSHVTERPVLTGTVRKAGTVQECV